MNHMVDFNADFTNSLRASIYFIFCDILCASQ